MKEKIRKNINNIVNFNGGINEWYMEELNDLLDCDFNYYDDYSTYSPQYRLYEDKPFNFHGFIVRYGVEEIYAEYTVNHHAERVRIGIRDIKNLQNKYAVMAEDGVMTIVIRETLYAKKQRTLDSFNGYVFNHGLNAYTATPEYENAIGIAHNPQWEICCSYVNQYCGNIGLFITGDCKLAANDDLYSELDPNGDRFATKNVPLIFTPEEIIPGGKYHHGEAILTNTKIIGIWHTEDADMNTVNEIADTLDIPVTQI